MNGSASPPRAIEKSNALHRRVREFARAALLETDPAPGERDAFTELALEIAAFQADYSPEFARLVESAGGTPQSVEEIPAVPAEAFRLTRVATHPAALDVAVFRTSGTTQSESGSHPVRELGTYDELSLLLAERTLFKDFPRRSVVVALGAFPGAPPTSSLGYMMKLFMERWDGRRITLEPEGSPFHVDAPERWLAKDGGIDVDGLLRAAKIAKARSEPLMVLGTSFAFAGLLEALDGDELPTPSRTRIMLTGGFKGRVKEVAPEELRAEVARTFRTSEGNVVSEYGMTELTSQLYEVSGGSLRHNVYAAPPWLRVIPVDPRTMLPVPRGEAGIARFVDLANVDSAVAVQTEDLIREVEDGIELLGRRPGATPRGCSLPFEGLVPHRSATR